MSRNYREEYARESPERKKARAKRNKARRQLMREGKVKVGDGKVAHHKKALSKGGSTSRKNVTVQSRRQSNSEGGKKQPRSGKAKGGRR